MKNATESPVLYEEKYLTFYDFIAMDSAGGEIENFTTMYDVDSLKKLCIKDQYSYCRQIVNTNRSIVFVPFYLFEKSKDDETEIKLFVTLLFAFLFVLSYLFYGCEHKQSITNKYPLFCKSFQKERACRINGVVLFTEELFTKDTKISAT